MSLFIHEHRNKSIENKNYVMFPLNVSDLSDIFHLAFILVQDTSKDIVLNRAAQVTQCGEVPIILGKVRRDDDEDTEKDAIMKGLFKILKSTMNKLQSGSAPHQTDTSIKPGSTILSLFLPDDKIILNVCLSQNTTCPFKTSQSLISHLSQRGCHLVL